jgi:N-acetyl-1-D-myo-inositol-2-amino-2-deoxy-alpha-D-glucopyranoside deacetylase
MNSGKKILVCLAHPDDESFGMGGTLAKYAQQGAEITLICATRGEAGEVEPELLEGYSSISELRTAELTCAANHLGLKEVIYLDYRDSGMNGSVDNQHKEAFINVPIDIVVERLVKTMRTLKPEIVVTFDPIGGYKHPDHIYIHQATVKAFDEAANPEAFNNIALPAHQSNYLFFHMFPRKFARFILKILNLVGKDATKFGRNKDINLEEILGDTDFPTHVKVNYSESAKQKEDASNCHVSQLSFGSGGGNFIFRIIRMFNKNVDYFMQAYPKVSDGYRKNGWS